MSKSANAAVKAVKSKPVEATPAAPEREEAPRNERRSKPADAPAPAAREMRRPEPPRRERPEREPSDRHRDRDRDREDRVVGFGSDVPAFLTRAVAPRPEGD